MNKTKITILLTAIFSVMTVIGLAYVSASPQQAEYKYLDTNFSYNWTAPQYHTERVFFEEYMGRLVFGTGTPEFHAGDVHVYESDGSLLFEQIILGDIDNVRFKWLDLIVEEEFRGSRQSLPLTSDGLKLGDGDILWLQEILTTSSGSVKSGGLIYEIESNKRNMNLVLKITKDGQTFHSTTLDNSVGKHTVSFVLDRNEETFEDNQIMGFGIKATGDGFIDLGDVSYVHEYQYDN